MLEIENSAVGFFGCEIIDFVNELVAMNYMIG